MLNLFPDENTGGKKLTSWKPVSTLVLASGGWEFGILVFPN